MSLERAQPPLYFEKPPWLIINLLENRPNPQLSPLNDNQWLRKFPNNNSAQHRKPIGCEIGVTPQEGALMAIRHLGKLAEVGVVQPTERYYFHDDHLYTVAEHVWGMGLSVLTRQQRVRQFKERYEQLHAYVDWVQTEQEPGVLWDIVYPTQHRVGWIQSDETQETRNYLIDTDPFLTRANHARFCNIRQNIDRYYADV